jgi:hypothetical protein
MKSPLSLKSIDEFRPVRNDRSLTQRFLWGTKHKSISSHLSMGVSNGVKGGVG